MNHYLYRHIRLDKYEPFYIGIGTKNKQDLKYNDYRRAKSKTKRNIFWHNITAKSDYKVEILLESNNYEFIKNKEIEFIKLYGRKDLNQGSLVNFTDGGDGNKGIIYSKEHNEKISKSNLGKPKFREKGYYCNKNMSKEKWEELKKDYLTGNYTIRELSRKYKYHESIISIKFKKENIKTFEIKTGPQKRNHEKNNLIIRDYLNSSLTVSDIATKYGFKDRQSIYNILKMNKIIKQNRRYGTSTEVFNNTF